MHGRKDERVQGDYEMWTYYRQRLNTEASRQAHSHTEGHAVYFTSL